MKKLVFLLLASLPVYLNAQTDDFNDGTDLPEWTRYNPIGVGSFSVVNRAYRIQTAPSGNPANPGRAGALRGEVSYTDFYICVDIVGWNTNVNAFGILARVNDPGLGRTDGYAMTWDQGGSDLDINWFTNEAPTAVAGTDATPLVVGRSYRMVFKGKGTQLTGEIYELPNFRTPMARVTGTDERIPSGVAGLIVYDNSTRATNITDTTFDNYFALDFEPPRLEIEPAPFDEVLVSWPMEPTHYVLQFCPAIGSNWIDILAFDVENGRRVIRDQHVHPSRFYRLRPGP